MNKILMSLALAFGIPAHAEENILDAETAIKTARRSPPTSTSRRTRSTPTSKRRRIATTSPPPRPQPSSPS